MSSWAGPGSVLVRSFLGVEELINHAANRAAVTRPDLLLSGPPAPTAGSRPLNRSGGVKGLKGNYALDHIDHSPFLYFL